MPDNTPCSTAAPVPDPTDIESIAADTALEILSNERRRYVLQCLPPVDNPMALADLADEVAALENGTGTADVSKEDSKDVYVSLSHADIPKLADADIVEYDQVQNTVTLTQNAAELRPLLEVVDDWPL
ncbi:DUF7344 domain-containing protein [Natrinema soli]|uniref:DUF7344 domain-containing protein n=1 Tax=Natrinema soli TaxID=1930624 RepID=A0ABD5SMF3_9EURY|nr:hypothetical protein [Natrinema soli]